MPKNMSEFLKFMDEQLWFRMLVCFLPPLVIVKLIGYLDEDLFLNKASTAVLLFFVGLYVAWPRLRALWPQAAVSDENEGCPGSAIPTPADGLTIDVPGSDQLAMLSELRFLCNEGDSESLRLIAVELAVNPMISFEHATRSAIARKKMASK